MNKKLKLGLALFIIGLLGVFTMLTVTIPLENFPKEVLDKISPQTLKFLVLLNPTILLLIAVVVGTVLYDKVGLTVPTISSILKIEDAKKKFMSQIKFGVLFGLVAGILTTIIGLIFKSSIPQELIEVGNKIKVTTLARFAYGGLTEEILMRFGFMTLVVWIIFKLSKKLNNSTYWIGIILASVLFAIGHFPVIFNAVQNPTISLLTYILVGNSIAGLFFGWLYWKKGLEAAFIGHIFAHVAMISGEQIF
ncbi:CPBP family intramembrane metalloprotease [Hymenobacter sp. BT188]|uniref:CPBP family intramembrane glutamic endopeptidase n=1 Tax=Hymenobacter sp. BT188 TaxID=2763504 RepID=UPI001651265C|nr:CPBP family intramembrane glutamic endopeptidase [Hymenobacter sp. BT188]MBC6605507.1 CPBP family intramembrane metalloprotease [Hymenobacter sp. BT188]